MEQMKQQFEKWFDENMYIGNRCIADPATKRRMFRAWAASRNSVEVEIPEHISQYNMFNGRATPEAANYDEALDDCAAAIRAAGLRVKEK